MPSDAAGGSADPPPETLPEIENARRVNGIVLLLVLVVLGMGVTGAYYQWKAPQIAADMRASRAELPGQGEGRLERWLEFGAPLVHARMVQVRYSAERPWLVTHVVEPAADGGAPEIWGIDVAHIDPNDPDEGLTTREGMSLVLHLGPVVLLGRGELGGDKARHVPRFPAGAEVPDPDARAREIVRWSLERLLGALEKDIEGAELEVRVGSRAEVPR